MRAALRATAVSLLLASSPALAASLRDALPQAARLTGIEGGSAFDALSDAIADTAARNLPIVAASAGFTYRYNPELEVFERTSETLGPLFLERPDTLGRGKLNVNVSYQYVELNEIDGRDLDSLEAPDPIVVRVADSAGNPLGFTANRLRYKLSLVNHIVGVSTTYGVLDNLDVNILVPIIVTNYEVSARNKQLFLAGTDGVFNRQPAPEQTGPVDEGHTGVGDVLLRAKYQLPRYGVLRSALGLQLRLPSGDEDEFQGTGSFEASPFFYASTVLWSRVEPHASLGVDLRADDVERSQGR